MFAPKQHAVVVLCCNRADCQSTSRVGTLVDALMPYIHHYNTDTGDTRYDSDSDSSSLAAVCLCCLHCVPSSTSRQVFFSAATLYIELYSLTKLAAQKTSKQNYLPLQYQYLDNTQQIPFSDAEYRFLNLSWRTQIASSAERKPK